MSDIQDKIASILIAQDVAWCSECNTYKRIDEHINHVAKVLVSELGLTRENSTNLDVYEFAKFPKVDLVRYVTEWVPE